MLLKSKDLWVNHVKYLKSKINTRLKLNKGTFILNNSSADELDDKNFSYGRVWFHRYFCNKKFIIRATIKNAVYCKKRCFA